MAAGVTYEPIATNTLTGTAASVTFSSISGAYTDLVLIVRASFDVTGDIRFRINGDTASNYSFTYLYGDGTSAGSIRAANGSTGLGDYYGAVTTTLGESNQLFSFMNYANATTYKTVLVRANRASGGTDAGVNLYRSTSAITSISLARGSGFGGTWQTGSTFTLYGIKAA